MEISELKGRVSVAQFCERRWGTRFKRDGQGRLKALCPLHSEKEPSFVLYPDGGWTCFGACNRSGDIFDLLMLKDGIEFQTALQEVARFAGVTMTPLTPQAKIAAQTHRTLEETLATARRHFETQLQATRSALDYCAHRGWTDETIKAHHLGYNDGSARHVLSKMGIPLNSRGAKAVLSIPTGMLIYPHIEVGRTVYLSGRLADPGKKGHYNPPTKLIGSRRPFWNAIQNRERVVIVEGQADAVTLGQWGISAVALAGCGLTATASQQLLRRLGNVQKVYVWPDADGNTDVAGLAAAVGPLTRVIEPPHGVVDANAWLCEEGATADDAHRLLEGARRWLSFLIEQAAQTKEEDDLRAVIVAFNRLDIWGQAAWRRRICASLDLTVDEMRAMTKAVDEELETGPLRQDDYVERQGMFCRVVLDQHGHHYRALSNFTAEIIEDVLEDDGEEIERRFIVQGKLVDGTILQRADVEAIEFARMLWIGQHWGARAAVAAGTSARDHLRAGIQLNSKSVRLRHEFSHLGWREIGDRQVYLSAAGAVGMENVQVRFVQDLLGYRLPTDAPKDVKAAIEASLQFLETGDYRVTVPLWSAMYLAPLTGIIPPSFTLWLYGTTGSLKSTATALAMCHYGKFTYNSPPASWTGTVNALEKKAFLVKDAPLWIDDYTAQSTLRGMNEIRRKADQLLRDWGNRAGRSRMRSNLRLRRTFVPRGLIISTAEQLPPGQSILARLFAVPVHPDDMTRGTGSALTHAQLEGSPLYPHAMAGYLLWLVDQWKNLETSLPERHLQCVEAARTEGEHLRMPHHVATMFIGFEMGLEFAQAVDALEAKEADGLRGIGWETLLSIGGEQQQVVAEEKPVDMYLDALEQMMAMGTIYLRHREWPDEGEKIRPRQKNLNAEFLGWYDEQFVYLLPKATFNTVVLFYRAGGVVFPDSERGVRVKLDEQGLLLPQGNRFSYQLRVGDSRYRVLRIASLKIIGLISGTGDNGDNDDNGDSLKQEELLL